MVSITFSTLKWVAYTETAFIPVFIFIAVYIFRKTAAWEFMKAQFRHGAVTLSVGRDNTGELKYTKREGPDSAEVEKVGPIQITTRSHILERKRRVPMYLMFADYGMTVPAEYPAIIQELREMGFPVQTFKAYKDLIRLGTDKTFQDECIEKIKDEDAKVDFKEYVARLKKLNIEIKPYKTYNIANLSNMFPHTISVAQTSNLIAHKVSQVLRNKELRDRMIFGMILLLFVGILVAAIAWKFMKGGTCRCVCETVATGVKTGVQQMKM